MSLQYDCHHVAEERFKELPRRLDREYEAEQWLMQLFLDAHNRSGWYAEVGANDPVSFSVTCPFERIGWKGMLVEPQPELAARCREERPNSSTVQAACGAAGGPRTGELAIPEGTECASMVGSDARVESASGNALRTITVDIRTLDDMLEEHAPPEVDLVSIDVEGFTTQVLDGFTVGRWRPRLLLIEDHLVDFSIMRHPSIRAAGYRLVKRTGGNSWFVPPELVDSVPIDTAERRRLRTKVARTPTRMFTRRVRDVFRRIRSVER